MIQSSPIIADLIQQGVEIKFMPASNISFSGAKKFATNSNIEIVGEIEGFYKSNAIWLYEEYGAINAFSRYGDREGVIKNIDDLTLINYRWWKTYRDSDVWKEIEPFWLKHMIRFDLIKEVIETSYIPKD
jgi:hypothetical protein